MPYTEIPVFADTKPNEQPTASPTQHMPEDLCVILPAQDETNHYTNDFQSMTSSESSVRTATDEINKHTSRSLTSESHSSSRSSSTSVGDVKELISWSKSLRKDLVNVGTEPMAIPDEGSDMETSGEVNYPPGTKRLPKLYFLSKYREKFVVFWMRKTQCITAK